jgi:hypothetical protein
MAPQQLERLVRPRPIAGALSLNRDPLKLTQDKFLIDADALGCRQQRFVDSLGRDSSSGLHLKAVALLIAIAAIDLLESFVGIGSVSKIDIEWRIAILATFVLTGILLAWMDRLATKSNEQEGFHNGPAVQ